MTRQHDRKRAFQRGNARHSNTMAGGRGDPRDHRREDQRLTDSMIDPDFFAVKDGRLTLEIGQKGMARLVEALAGDGLRVSTDGKLSVSSGSVKKVIDSTTGTPSDTVPAIPTTSLAAAVEAIRNALATLTSRVNTIIGQPTSQTRA